MQAPGSFLKSFVVENKFIFFIIVLSAFVVYGNGIRNDYNIDDFIIFQGNKYVSEGVKGIPGILTHSYAENKYFKLDYRPVALVSFALEKQFFDLNVHVSHFFNVLLYAILLLLIYTVLIKVFYLDKYSPFLPLLITLLYAVHPAHTEIVCSLKNRDELFAHIFGFLFIYFIHKTITSTSKKYISFALSLFFLVLAYLSKLSSLPFLVIAFLMFWYYGKKSDKIYLLFFTALSVMTVAYVYGVSHNLHRQTTFYENPLIGVTDMFTTVGTSSYIFLFRLKFLLFPFPLRYYYGYNMFPGITLSHPVALVSFILQFGLIVFAIYIRKKNKDLSFFILAYFISIAVYSNVLTTLTGMFAERTLFLSSFWFCICLAWLGLMLIEKFSSAAIKKMIAGFFVILFCTYSYITICRNFQWKNIITLMDHDVHYLEKSTLANLSYANNLAKEYNNQTDTAVLSQLSEKALKYYNQSISTAPKYAEPYFQLAEFYKVMSKNDEALKNYKTAAELEPKTPDYVYGLAKQYFDIGDYGSANDWFRKNYEINPADSSVLFYYAQTADMSGDVELSKKLNNELLKKYPESQYPYLNLGTLYFKNKQVDSAVYYYSKAVEYGCRNPKLINDLANYFQSTGETKKQDYYMKLWKEVQN